MTKIQNFKLITLFPRSRVGTHLNYAPREELTIIPTQERLTIAFQRRSIGTRKINHSVIPV